MRGYSGGKNALGVYAIKWHYTANFRHDPDHVCADEAERLAMHPDDSCDAIRQAAREWLAKQEESYPDPNDRAREMEINWAVAKGQRVFPQYTTNLHERRLEKLRHRIVYRATDVGWHCPVTLFAQIDGQGRLAMLKECIGAKQTTREFATTLMIPKTNEWFPMHTPGFEDFCDPAANQVKSIDSEKSERRDIEVLEGLGIHPRYEWGWSRKDGRALIHQLLAVRADGTPSMYVDPAGCPVLSSCMLGKYVYPETQNGKLREEPNDEEHPFGDVMAALRYLVTGLHAKLALTRFKASTLAGATPSPARSGYGIARRG